MINCEKIIDSIHVGILTIDAELNIYYVNKWFAVHSDIDDADSCSRACSVFLAAHDLKQAIECRYAL